MAGAQPKSRFSKVMEIFLWLAGLEVLAGIAFDGRLEPVILPAAGSKLLIITFSPGCPACQANQDGWMRLASTLERKGVRVVWVSRDPIEITRDYCLKHGIRLSDTLADPPYKIGRAHV